MSFEPPEHPRAASCQHGEVRLTLTTGCAAPGERRIGYVSIMRLVESVRELHWRRDVLSVAGASIDSITRSLSVEFLRPVEPATTVAARYRVMWCRRRSYGLQVSLDSPTGTPLVRAQSVNVFYDPVVRRSAYPTAAVLEALGSLARGVDAQPTDTADQRLEQVRPTSQAGTRR